MNEEQFQKIADTFFRNFEKSRDEAWAKVPYPRRECPSCGCPIEEKEFTPTNLDMWCGVCENRKLSDFVSKSSAS